MNAKAGFSLLNDYGDQMSPTYDLGGKANFGFEGWTPENNIAMGGAGGGWTPQLGGPAPDANSFWSGLGSTLSGGSILKTGQTATWGQNAFGYLDEATGKKVGGFAGGAFNVASDLAGAYMGYMNMKRADEALKFQKESWMKQYQAQKHDYNQSVRGRNAALESQQGGSYMKEELK